MTVVVHVEQGRRAVRASLRERRGRNLNLQDVLAAHTQRSGYITHCQVHSKTDALLQEQNIRFALKSSLPTSECILLDNSGREEREGVIFLSHKTFKYQEKGIPSYHKTRHGK